MGFLKKLFGQKPEQAPLPPDNRLAQQFDAEWTATVERYRIVTGMGESMRVVLKHPQTQEIMAPHAGLNQTFREWEELPTLYARRRLIFETIAEMGGGFSKVWQAANYMVADARADEALEILESEGPPLECAEDYAPHCATYAKAYIALTREAEAVDWARRAVNAAPEDTHFQTVLADALHLSGEHEEAHAIYERLMAMASLADADKDEAVREMFTKIFARETGVLSSPVMAFQTAPGLADPQQAAEFWAQGEDEFYDSPQFRLMHAYHLAEQGDMQRFVAKLGGLVNDMPWVKEANLNLIHYLAQVDPTGQNIFPELQAEIRERIRENGWTGDGMNRMEIRV